MPDVTITLKTINDSDRGVKGAIGSFTELSSILGLASKGLDYLKKGYDATVGSTVKYANEVRKLSQVSGTTAEESSRLLQVLDDFKISADQVTAATRKLTAQGLSPTTETLAKLSDEFLTLNPGAERAAFLMENFGRAGQDFAEVMLQGGDALREMNAAVDENLILTEKELKQAREYELALDSLNDAKQGLSVSIGTQVIPALTNMMDGLSNTEGFSRNLRIAIEELQRVAENPDAWDTATRGYAEMAKAAEESNAALSENTHLLGANTEAMLKSQEGQAEFATGAEELKGKLLTGQIGLADFNLQMAELHKATHATAIPAFDAMNDRATFLTENFGSLAKDIPANMNTAASGVSQSADFMVSALRDPISRATTLNEKIEATAAKSGSEWNYTFNIITRGSIPNLPELNQQNQAQVNQCFIAGTLITLADGTQKPIEEMQIGDEVTTYDFIQGKNVAAVVSEVFHHDAIQDDYYLLINEIGVTPNHPIWTPEGYVDAGDLKIGDCLVTITGRFVPILSIATIGESVPTYNLHIEHPSHNYYAAGVLVHNKAGGGQVFGPGNGMQDGFLVPMANGEYVVRSSVVKKPGVLEFLEMLNSGGLGRGLAAGGLARSREGPPPPRPPRRPREPQPIPGGGGGGSSPIELPTEAPTDSSAILTAPMTGGATGVNSAAGSMMAAASVNTMQGAASLSELRQINQKLGSLVAKTPNAADNARLAAQQASLNS